MSDYSCILATDMAKHSEILVNFKAVVPKFDFKNKDNRTLVRTSGIPSYL